MSKWRRYVSRIAIRVMAFNLLLVMLPIAGILYLDIYEDHLVEAQERAMFEQAELLASFAESSEDGASLDSFLRSLDLEPDSRVRIVDEIGRVVADSGGRRMTHEDVPSARRSLLYRLGSFLLREPLRLIRGPEAIPLARDLDGSLPRLAGEEVDAALAGARGHAKRMTNDSPPSIVLYAAVPVRPGGGTVAGAVVVARTTAGILQDLYEIRLVIFRVFLIAVVLAMILSLWVATTIVGPIRRLREEAGMILDRRGRLRGVFRGTSKQDEIGDLSRALERLTSRLDAHQSFSESFASDVSHEFKNPLASIRNATEMLSEVERTEDRRRFLAIVEKEVARMEQLLSALRDVTLIDARMPEESREPVSLGPLLQSIVEGFEFRTGRRVRFALDLPERELTVHASEDRLLQVFENLLDNAVSFSPPGGLVRVAAEREGDVVSVLIVDQGPGFPAGHQERVFDRFFTYRPDEDSRDLHTGLGLAIVRAIVEGYGGKVSLRNRDEGGAVAEVRLALD